MFFKELYSDNFSLLKYQNMWAISELFRKYIVTNNTYLFCFTNSNSFYKLKTWFFNVKFGAILYLCLLRFKFVMKLIRLLFCVFKFLNNVKLSYRQIAF